MEKGTNINEIFANMENKMINIEFNSKLWEFVVRDITWSEKNQIISKSANVDKNNKASSDVNRYNQLYLEKSIVKAPFEMTPTNILKLDADFGDLLIDKIVNRKDIEEEEMGN